MHQSALGKEAFTAINIRENSLWKKGNLKRYGIKNGKRPTSHRYDRLPLLRSRPGGVQQELVVWDLPVQIYSFV